MRYRPASRHRQASCPHSSGSIAAAIGGGGARKIQLSLPKPLPFAQVEDGAQCPVTMTYAVMTVMQRHSAVARGPRGRCWCRQRDSNPRPSVYKTAALPTELCRRGHATRDHEAARARTEGYLTRVSLGRSPGRGGVGGSPGSSPGTVGTSSLSTGTSATGASAGASGLSAALGRRSASTPPATRSISLSCASEDSPSAYAV